MKRSLKIFSFLSLCLLLVGCPKDDGPTIIPARPHADVYPEDVIKIEDYLKSHYLVAVDDNADGNIHISEIELKPLDVDHTVSIWDQTEYPLLTKMVKLYGVEFNVYYLKLDGKTDTDADGEKPAGLDRILVSYKGTLLDDTQFDSAPNPIEFNLLDVVKGWEYIFPEFRAGYFDTPGSDGTLNPQNYGSGVMFLPSGLGYYNSGFGSIPNYAPLVFTFNLFAVTRLDQDFDKIQDRYEYSFNEDGTLIDADADGIPNVFDADDDNDGYLTKEEIKFTYTISGTTYTRYYPWDGAAVNDISTPFDETHGIPDCANDYTTTTRLRKHLNRTCH